MAFDNKSKLDLLNYHMGELLETLVHDSAFYFIDCIIREKGVFSVNESE